MNHMAVNEGYRMWHGEPFREGYLQAPPSDHFDLHYQGPTTDTRYKPYELIPGLNVGGYFDAGDFSAIPGNVAPGLLFRQPDHFENFDDWPFLWGQNEGTIAGNTNYVIFGSAFKGIVR